MWRFVVGLLALAPVAGCTDSSACKRPHSVVSSDDTAPGTLRAGMVFQSAFPAIAPLSDGGVVCLSCTGFVHLDRRLDVTATGGAAPYNLAVGPDDTIYLIQLPGGYRDASGIELAAFAPDGTERWAAPLPGGSFARPLIAVAGGVYAETDTTGQAEAIFFAAADGAQRAVAPGALLAADRGGVFTTSVANRDSRAPEVTIRRLDDAGATQWTRTWKAPTDGLVISAAAADPAGGMIVAASATAPLDLGDRTLTGPGGQGGSFVIALDAAGATRWAYAVVPVATGATGPSHLAVTPAGDVLLAGAIYTGELPDAYLAVASATGVTRTHVIDGAAEQRIEGLAAAPDGSAWLQVANEPLEGEREAIMHVGGHEFREADIYVFSIVP